MNILYSEKKKGVVITEPWIQIHGYADSRGCPKSRQTLLDFPLDTHLAGSAHTFAPQIGDFQESFSTFHCPERKFRTFRTASKRILFKGFEGEYPMN